MKNFQVGDLVRSRFKAPWKGIVAKVEKRFKQSDLITTHMHTDRHGNPARKAFKHVLDEHWLELLLSPTQMKQYIEERLPRPSTCFVRIGNKPNLVHVYLYLRPLSGEGNVLTQLIDKADQALLELSNQHPEVLFEQEYR